MATGYREGFRSAFKPRPQITGSQWADSYRYVAPGTSSEPGRWRTSRVPYMREMLDTITDRSVEHVVAMMSSQVGKSELLINAIGYYVDQEPAPILLVSPTVETAESFSKERIDPTFQYTPAMRSKLIGQPADESKGSSRKKSDTIRQKMFRGGYLALVGSNSTAGLASRPVRVLLMDEVDRYVETKEGDPRDLAMQRTANYHNRKIFEVSTPVDLETSMIYQTWEQSDQRRYFVPCKACGAFQVLKWSQVSFAKEGTIQERAATAFYKCEHCGHNMRGSGRISDDLLDGGRWIAQKPGASIVGFHINALYSPWVELWKLVGEFLKARKTKDRAKLKAFINLKLGEPWEDEAEKTEWETLHKNHRHRYGEFLPANVLLATAGVDTQDEYLAVEVVGWGVGKESWGIKYAIFPGDTSQPKVWQELDEFLQRTWQTADGRHLPITMALVDSGGHRTDEVYNFCKTRQQRGIYAIRGSRSPDAPIIPSKPSKNGKGGLLFEIGVGLLKSTTLSRAAIADEGPGYCHFALEGEAGYSEEYFKGLLSERYEFKYSNGKYVRQWKKVYERNEPLDCRNYATAAMELSNIDLDVLAERIKGIGSSQQPAAQPAARRGRRQLSPGI